jgi:hypothetical protein
LGDKLAGAAGDYANVGQNIISVVDADSFWVDGYFEEIHLGSIHEGDPAEIKLMGYSRIIRGHVGSVARGINVPTRKPISRGGIGGSKRTVNRSIGDPRFQRERRVKDDARCSPNASGADPS